jgi:hypothetical protein
MAEEKPSKGWEGRRAHGGGQHTNKKISREKNNIGTKHSRRGGDMGWRYFF